MSPVQSGRQRAGPGGPIGQFARDLVPASAAPVCAAPVSGRILPEPQACRAGLPGARISWSLQLELAEPAAARAPVAQWVLQLIKAAATPLVFFAVLEAILRFRVAGADFLKLLTIASINAGLAIALGIGARQLKKT